MADLITKNVPIAKISGTVGRQASFEVRVNDELVYSKLQTMALPDFNAVSDMIKEVSEGKPIRRIKKEQPSECDVM